MTLYFAPANCCDKITGIRNIFMILCSEPTFETWIPPLAEAGIATSPWTRMCLHGIELCNSLEWTDWKQNPVQVQLCEACGTIGCASSGYIHLSTIGNLVLWTFPQIDNTPVDELTFFPASALERLGLIAFPSATWNAVAETNRDVPPFSELAVANGRALADAWCRAPRHRAPEHLIATLRDRLMAADTLSNDTAIEKAIGWLDWFTERSQAPVSGHVLDASDLTARIETLYFDGPAKEDWPAFAELHGSYYPLITHQHFFVPFSPA